MHDVAGALTATAQPRSTYNDYRQLPHPHGAIIKSTPADNATRNDMGPYKRATKARAGEVVHQVDFVLDFDPDNQQAWKKCMSSMTCLSSASK